VSARPPWRGWVETIGDLARLPEASLVDALGKAHGHHLHELACGRDDRPVEPDRETKSIGQEETFPRDVADREALDREIRRMAERVGTRLREHGLAGRTVTIKVRFPDFRTITRSATLPEPFAVSAEIARLALGLLEKVDVTGGIRLLGVTVSNLTAGAVRQGSLFAEETTAEPRVPIQSVIDSVRARFGADALGTASMVEPPSD
jgi:DNA polymerase-4